jgi:hypothetical protein
MRKFRLPRKDPVAHARDTFIISRFEQAALNAGTAGEELVARVAEHTRLFEVSCLASEAKVDAWEATRIDALLDRSEARAEWDWSTMKVQLAKGPGASPFTVEEMQQLLHVRVASNQLLDQLLAGTAAAADVARCRTYVDAWQADRAATAALWRYELDHRTDDLPPDLADWLRRQEERQAQKA